MAHSYHEIAFTPTILDMQVEAGSREGYASMGGEHRYADLLTAREAEFIAARDSFYMASVSETGWPYVQHRGGPAGFMKVLDNKTIGFADYAGNRQYVSTGNFRQDDRVSLFFMDYPNRRRLKMFGRVRVVDATDSATLARLEDPDYPVQIERAFVITVEGFDWNCPAHITPRFSEREVGGLVEELTEENRRLKTRLAGSAESANESRERDESLGEGELELVISGIRQLTSRVRAYELRHPEGAELPAVQPGSHLRIPVRLPNGDITERHYSIASNPARRDAWEFAVQREDEGTGGSIALHQAFQLGMHLRVAPPANHFSLHDDERPALLIAGGIGITPIKAMAQALDARGADFHLHYAGRSHREMAFRDRLQRHLGERMTVYGRAEGESLDLESVIAAAPAEAVLYVCGPDRLVAGVLKAARAGGIPADRVRAERFS